MLWYEKIWSQFSLHLVARRFVWFAISDNSESKYKILKKSSSVFSLSTTTVKSEYEVVKSVFYCAQLITPTSYVSQNRILFTVDIANFPWAVFIIWIGTNVRIESAFTYS